MRYLRRLLAVAALLAGVPAQAGPGHDHDPLRAMLSVDRLERGTGGAERNWTWDVDGYLGKDLHKLWLKSEGEYAEGRTEEAELQVLHSVAVAPHWDLQWGWRSEFEPRPARQWLALGVQGITPGWLETDAALFLGESGRVQLRTELEYELRLAQRLELVPRLALNWQNKADADRAQGRGLTGWEGGLRLRYQVTRRFVPYVGIAGYRLLGGSARMAGGERDDVQFIFGLHGWW